MQNSALYEKGISRIENHFLIAWRIVYACNDKIDVTSEHIVELQIVFVTVHSGRIVRLRSGRILSRNFLCMELWIDYGDLPMKLTAGRFRKTKVLI